MIALYSCPKSEQKSIINSMRYQLKHLSGQSLGVMYMALASIFFFLMGLMVKLAQGIPIAQIVFFRAIVAFLLCLVQLKISRVSPIGHNPKWLFLRGFFGTSALILYFTTLQQLPMGVAVTIQYLSPIFTTLFTVVLLKEVFFLKQILFFGVSFLGVILIQETSNQLNLTPYVFGIVAAVLSAAAYTTIRKIGISEHPLVIILYFPLVTIPIIGPFAYTQWVPPTAYQWVVLICVGIFVQIAQYFMTRAYQLGEGGVVSIAGYLGVIWAAIGGHIWFHEKLSLRTLFGMGLVLIGVAGNTLYRKWRENDASAPL